jgi:enoyl-CoA hydratase
MEFETILFKEDDSGIATITINRLQKLNALNSEAFKEIGQMIRHVNADTNIRVAIITGIGDKAFAAGTDIKAMEGMSPLESRNFAFMAGEVLTSIENSDKPVIAAVNGLALGGGCELAMACDLRIASDQAKFGQPEINLGIIPGSGGTQRLPRLIGISKAKELLLTGEMLDADEAQKIGLINKVLPHKDLMQGTLKIARKIAAKSPIALKLVKTAVNKGMHMDLPTALTFEIELFSTCFSTDDQKEGFKAFFEKRLPVFRGM